MAANPNAEARRGTVAMGGQILEVVQEGVACRFDLQPTNQNMGAEGGSGSFTVEAPSGCSWTPTASHDWITITNGGSQSGNGSVNFSVAPNTAGVRDGTIRVGGQAFGILQSAPSCRYQLSAITGSFGGAGGSGTVNVTAASTCTWTASTNVPWISIVGGASDGGNGTVSFTVQANTGPARNGILTIGSQRFTVTQLQAQCNYSISPAGQTFTAGGGQGTVTISTNSVCTWNTSDVPAWVTGMPSSGTGTQAIAFTVEPNQGPDRSAAIIIGGQSFAVTQTRRMQLFARAGQSQPVGGRRRELVCGEHRSRLRLDKQRCAGVDHGRAGERDWPADNQFHRRRQQWRVTRSANIVIGGQTFTVTQDAAAVACSYSLNPTSHNATAGGGPSSVDVYDRGGLRLDEQRRAGVDHIVEYRPAGPGTTTINFTVAANPDPTSRTANITSAARPSP